MGANVFVVGLIIYHHVWFLEKDSCIVSLVPSKVDALSTNNLLTDATLVSLFGIFISEKNELSSFGCVGMRLIFFRPFLSLAFRLSPPINERTL